MSIWEITIWAGAVLTLAGLAALMWCILTVIRAQRSGLEDQQMRQKLRSVMAVNMAALMVSVLGLSVVVLGVFLG